ncbi:MAG: hypothetical protein ACYC91_20725 [Solirubrobacteraceae bacterium]
MAGTGKITVELDANEVARAREAMGSGADESDAVVVGRVLNGYLMNALIRSVQARSNLSEEEADRLAVEEVRAYRSERNNAS